MDSTEDLAEFEQQEQYCEEDNVCTKTYLDVSQAYENCDDNELDHTKNNALQVEDEFTQGVSNGEGEIRSVVDLYANGGLQDDSQVSGMIIESTPQECDDVESERPFTEESLHSVEPYLEETEEECEEKQLPEELTNQEYETNEVVELKEDIACDYSMTKPDLVPCFETIESEDYEDADVNKVEESHDPKSEVDVTAQLIEVNENEVCDIQELSKTPEDIPISEEMITNMESSFENESFVIQDECEGSFYHEDEDQHPIAEEIILSQQSHEVVESAPLTESFPSTEFSDEKSEPSVVENTPVRMENVVREDDPIEEVTCLKRGFAKDLAGFWSSPKGEVCSKQVKQPIDLPRDDAPSVVENSPNRLEGVVRSDDVSDDHVVVEHGLAKMMVHLFQSKKEEAVTKELKLDINFEEPGVYENNPQEREGVVKCSDIIDDIRVEKGAIRMITNKFQSKEDATNKPRELIKMEPAHGPSVIENTPEPSMADVIRSDSKPEDLSSLQGMTKNLVHKWKTNDLLNSKSATNKVGDFEAILKAGMAAESGVFENQPSVRNDVAREDDEHCDIISTQTTKSTRDLWNQKINQESRSVEKAPQLVRFTPPRELSPPRKADDNFKSFQQITLA